MIAAIFEVRKIYKKCVLIVKSLLKTMKIKSIINYVTFNNRFVDLLKLHDCCNKINQYFIFSNLSNMEIDIIHLNFNFNFISHQKNYKNSLEI